MALRAALMADAEPVARSRAASGAKAKIGKCARFVAEQSVQLHGAMGVTEELDIGSYFKRLLAFDTLFGGSAHHYRRYAALGGRAHRHHWRDAVLGAAMGANDRREDYVRAVIDFSGDVPVASPFDLQDSSMLRTFADANALIVRAAFAPPAAAGSTVRVLMLR